MSLDPQTKEKITGTIAQHRVCLFMKGNRQMPQCGFSAKVVQVLEELIPGDYETVNVLADQSIREGIKLYSNWPTIPQLYVGGEFVGGCDIVTEMHASGALAEKLGVDLDAVEPPKVTVSPAAAEALNAAIAEAGEGRQVRLSMRGSEFALDLGAKGATDFEVTSNGATLLVPKTQARQLDGVTIDYVQEPMGAGFRITKA